MYDIRTYHDSAMVTRRGPFDGGMIRATGALCADGIRRNAHATTDGIADTFYSIPAYVYVRGVRVYGYVTIETLAGYSTETADDPATVKFVAYTYRKNHGLIIPTVSHPGNRIHAENGVS